MPMCGLVGEEAPLFLDSGLNRAVAGDAFGFWSRPFPGELPGGVAIPFKAAELRAAAVCLGENPEAAEDVL